MSVLRVAPEAVEQSGGQVAGAPSAATLASQVTAAASDPVSVSVAYAHGPNLQRVIPSPFENLPISAMKEQRKPP